MQLFNVLWESSWNLKNGFKTIWLKMCRILQMSTAYTKIARHALHKKVHEFPRTNFPMDKKLCISALFIICSWIMTFQWIKRWIHTFSFLGFSSYYFFMITHCTMVEKRKETIHLFSLWEISGWWWSIMQFWYYFFRYRVCL